MARKRSKSRRATTALKCNKTKYRAAFRRLIKNHPFKTAVRLAWKQACPTRR